MAVTVAVKDKEKGQPPFGRDYEVTTEERKRRAVRVKRVGSRKCRSRRRQARRPKKKWRWNLRLLRRRANQQVDAATRQFPLETAFCESAHGSRYNIEVIESDMQKPASGEADLQCREYRGEEQTRYAATDPER